MRQRHFLVACAIILALWFLNRKHLRVLAEVAGTYSGFYPYLHGHPETIQRYPLADNSSGAQPQRVPKIIHQIFLTEGRNSSLSKYIPAAESCRDLHPDWTCNLWTDENATSFMREHYPTTAKHYEGYGQSIQRANVLRYALLDHFGGVYLDLDVTCLTPLDNLLHLPWLTPGAYPAGVNNAFILTRPHHGLLAEILGRLPSSDLGWGMPYIENMLSTGCMYFSNRWMSYTSRLAQSAQAIAPEDRVYVLADQESNLDPHMLRGKVTTPLFAHGGASSWHGWDAAMIVMIGKHYGWFMLLLVGGFISSTTLVCCLFRASGKRKHRRSSGHRRQGSESSGDLEQLLVNKEGRD